MVRVPLSPTADLSRSPNCLGEVVQTSTTEYVAQCFSPDELKFPSMPALGSWVRVADGDSDRDIFGVICHATTVPVDSMHRARPLGLTPEQLQAQHPQIFAMLQTEFRVAIVGFEVEAHRDVGLPPSYYLPPSPPQLHQAVVSCTPAEVGRFCQSLRFLRTLLGVQGIPSDELVAAAVRQSYGAIASLPATSERDGRQWLVQVGRELAIQLKDDYDRLRAILQKIELY
ncbi:MAG: hypothetical protein AAFX40_17290 [Cyanobacteria bacterium J06639_1]